MRREKDHPITGYSESLATKKTLTAFGDKLILEFINCWEQDNQESKK